MPTCYKLARLLSGKSQLEVSIATGMYQSLISDIETGRKNPRPHEVEALAEVYGMTPAQIQSLTIKEARDDVSA